MLEFKEVFWWAIGEHITLSDDHWYPGRQSQALDILKASSSALVFDKFVHWMQVLFKFTEPRGHCKEFTLMVNKASRISALKYIDDSMLVLLIYYYKFSMYFLNIFGIQWGSYPFWFLIIKFKWSELMYFDWCIQSV